MICQPCREAGAFTKVSRYAEQAVRGTRVYLEQQALMLHKECQGGTWCDCQHKLWASS